MSLATNVLILGPHSGSSVSGPVLTGGQSVVVFDSADDALPQVFYLGASGTLGPLAIAEWGNRVIDYAPGALALTGSTRGTLPGAFGTVSHPVPSTTGSFRGTMAWTAFTSTTAVNNPAGMPFPSSGSLTPSIWRGNRPGFGGWFISARFSTTTGATSGSRGFCGFGNAIMAVNPQTLSSSMGMQFNDGDDPAGNWFFGTNNGQPLAQRWDLGTGARRSDDNVYDFYSWAPPNADWMSVAVVNTTSGTVLFNSVLTGSLPDRHAFHYFEIVKNAANSGVVQTMFIQRVYIVSMT